jgi:HPt (histidine-containing phosphotransfer) domain-containing protein
MVHQLKGSGGGYGFAQLTQRAAEVEKCIKAGESMEIIARQVDWLVKMIQKIEGFSQTAARE